MKAPSLMWRSLFSLYRKLRRISYKAKKRSAWIALRRNRICRFATRCRRRILRSRILFSHVWECSYFSKKDTSFPKGLGQTGF